MGMQPHLQLFFVTLNPHTNKFEYQSNEYMAPPVNPLSTVDKMTLETYPDLHHRSIAQATTWYFEEPDRLMLTFMVYSDYFDFADAESLKFTMPKTKQWLALTPDAFDEPSLVSHALRHLSYHIITQKPPKWMLASTIEKLAKLEKELAAEVLKAEKEMSQAVA